MLTNLTQVHPAYYVYRTVVVNNQCIKIIVDHVKGAKAGVYVSAMPVTITSSGFEQIPIFQIAQVCVQELPRKNDKITARCAELLDPFMPELAQAFEAHGKAGLNSRLCDVFGEADQWFHTTEVRRG